MRLLVTGAGGMLAKAVIATAQEEGDEVIALDRGGLDVSDPDAALTRVADADPDAVIHCAAFTAVDEAESEPELAMLVNAEGARNVARACQKIGAVFVYPSTDYVFDGAGTRPYRPDDPPNPINAYGRSKLEGELAALEAGRHLVVRTSWLYGAGGKHFVDTIARLGRERAVLDVVGDQVGRPTWTGSLAATMRKLLKAEAIGTFHASDSGPVVSWAGFAEEVVARTCAPAVVRRVSSREMRRPAPRPSYSVFDLSETERVIGERLPDWKDSLDRFLNGRRSSAG